MRTKHLITALTLPALMLTGCAEDLTLENATNSLQKDRRTVDVPNVKLDVNEAETRLALSGNSYVFEAGDLLGACLMDDITTYYQNPNYKWGEWFKFINYIHTNYKFSYNTTTKTFENNALMSEGNYFFYYPYDVTMTDRNAFEQELNAEQILKKNADGSLNPRQTVLDNQLFLGHSAISGDREDHDNLAVTMKAVYAYPAFRIAYSSPQPIVVKKVAFKQVDNEGDVANDGTVESFNTTLKVDPSSLNVGSFKTDNPKVLKDDVTFYSMTDKTTANQISVEIPDVQLSSGSTVAGYVVIPAGVYDANVGGANKSLWMYVYTDKGIVRTYLNEKNPEQEPGGSPSDNVWTKANYTNFQPNNGMIIDMGFSYEAISAPTSFTVSTTEDFELIMSWQKNQSVPTTLTATIVGDKIELSKTIYDVLNNENLTLNLITDGENEATVTIPVDAPANALDRINILTQDKLTVINKANLTVRKDLQNGTDTYAPVLLKNEGTMTFTGNTYNFSNCEFVNEGTVVLNNQATQIPMVMTYIGNKQFKNRGVLTIASDVNLNGTGSNGILNQNAGKLTINKDVVVKGRISNELADSYYATPATIVVNGTWEEADGINKASIVVASTGKIVANELENGQKYIYNYLSQLVYRGTIENSGIILNIKNGSAGGNEGALIVMKANTARLITKSGSVGEIDNTVCSTAVSKQATETIFCQINSNKTAQEVADLALNSNANRLDFINNVTLTIPSKTDGTKNDITITIPEVKVNGNLTIDGAKNVVRFVNGTTGTKMNIVGGTTEITAQTLVSLGASGKIDGTLDVNGGHLIIRNNAKLYGKKGTNVNDSNVENYGSWITQ